MVRIVGHLDLDDRPTGVGAVVGAGAADKGNCGVIGLACYQGLIGQGKKPLARPRVRRDPDSNYPGVGEMRQFLNRRDGPYMPGLTRARAGSILSAGIDHICSNPC